ncbi:MAG TPA: DNA repair protein RadA [Peptococcaceae bacterium]|jgi:DNA repair protein RadA/Sms|nr:DNA repair protein RadA [Peptococcaceae bacterium]HPZ71300.1 DNA repair protein RadA [Peptococcaceae bacterium]HQD54773.1 DNA repair protein RadA [Peptococcaceae bacterium]
MGKQKSKFVCQQCGYETPGWLGKCPECGTWNSLIEELVEEQAAAKHQGKRLFDRTCTEPQALAEIDQVAVARLDLGMSELNRVLGGGLVLGTIVLLAGDPGIGKSTLLLQAASYAAERLNKVLYISGEESAQQIKMRASRLHLSSAKLLIWPETDLERIEQEIKKTEPGLVIVDSIQTVFCGELASTPGSIGQIKEATARLTALAKSLNLPVIIVGHVTKEGSIAGPRVLEHMVDTVLYFEGERHQQYRILRAIKNRFGSTFELGVFEMQNEGLVEITNPSQAFLAERPVSSPGSVVTASIEGTRPLLVEIQALVSHSVFGQPRRIATGTDYNRVNLIMAVLEKRVGLNFSQQDAYVNIVGGIKIQEPALDLAIATALTSSFKNRSCLPGLLVMGEVGLTGEIRGISHLDKRLHEAKKLGFSHCLVPSGRENRRQFGKEEGLEIIEVKTLREALDIALV